MTNPGAVPKILTFENINMTDKIGLLLERIEALPNMYRNFKTTAKQVLTEVIEDQPKIYSGKVEYKILLKDAREEIGLTQYELSKMLNIRESTISEIERGKKLPDGHILLKYVERGLIEFLIK